MKEQKQYYLTEAIKQYKTKPLNNNLAKIVTDRVFSEKEKSVFDSASLLYISIGIIAFTAVIYYFKFFSSLSLTTVLSSIAAISFSIWLSAKEYSVLKKKMIDGVLGI